MDKEMGKKLKGSEMYGNTACNVYAQNDIGVESPAKLVEMMYEGVLRFNAQAKKAIKDKDIEKRVYWTNRSIAVVSGLISGLNMEVEGTMPKYLQGLYEYQIKLLSSAGSDNNLEKLDESSNVFKVLLDSWRETTNVA